MPADPAASSPAAAPFRPRTPVVIGIVGGIAAGKSTVAACFAAHGLVHVDADAHARAVTADPSVLAALATEFGPAVLSGGELDRPGLAKLVFGDAKARVRLEAILHPPIRARIVAAIGAAEQAGQSVLLDAPLLLEAGLVQLCDHVVFVEVDAAVRAERAKQRGWNADELARREAAQLPLTHKRARASAMLDNNGDFAALRRQVAALLQQWRREVPA
jgi:dephospho-CoA kinase